MPFDAGLSRRVAGVLDFAAGFVTAVVFATARFAFNVGDALSRDAGLPELTFFPPSAVPAAAGLRRMDEEVDVDVVMMDSCEECIDSIRLAPDFDLIRIK